MEIERKWLVNGWPKGLRPEHIYTMEQGYLALRPTTVRIRREAERGGTTAYILCFKSKGGLVREDVGQVDVKEHYAFVAVRRGKVKQLLTLLRGEKIKGMKTLIEEAR